MKKLKEQGPGKKTTTGCESLKKKEKFSAVQNNSYF